MANYTMSDVSIEGAYQIPNVTELSMDIGVNRHGVLIYGGIIPESLVLPYIRQDAAQQAMRVFIGEQLEFYGYPQDINVSCQLGHYYLRVTLVTSSQLMDLYPCARLFQDTDYTYEELLKEAYEDTGIGNLVAVRGKERITRPILQYCETDWQFTLRMAARLGTIVMPNVFSEPQLALGIPPRTTQEEPNDTIYSVKRTAGEYRRKQAIQTILQRNDAYGYRSNRSYGDVDYHNFLCYTMESCNRYQLGDRVSVDGTTFTVMQKTLEYKKGEIRERYLLGHENDFAVPFYHNKMIAGLELTGTVLDRSDQSLQLLLDIDAWRKECDKTWIGYAPTSNNGMYSMPLVGEKVVLQWQSAGDDDVIAVRPFRQNGQDLPHNMERHFLTEHDNHLIMVSGKMAYQTPIGSISWLQHQGFDLSSAKQITIRAEQDLTITSQAQVRMYSPEEISICKVQPELSGEENEICTLKPKSSIDLFSNELHIKAKKKVKSTSKVNQYKRTILPKRIKPFSISASVAAKLSASVSMDFN